MLWKIAVAVVATFSPALLLADEPVVIKAEEAAANVDKECIVEFVVKAGRMLPDKNVCFLNSADGPRSDKNFTAFIGGKGLRAFKDEAKVDNPASKYVGKTIRVKGKIKLHKNKPEIEVDRPDQIEIVEEAKTE